MVEKAAFVSSEPKSVTLAISSLTFLIEVAVSSIRAAIASASIPAKFAVFPVTSALIKFRSAALLKSSVLAVTEAFTSLRFSAFTLTTSITEPNAAENASASLAPAPSAADANELTAVMIC